MSLKEPSLENGEMTVLKSKTPEANGEINPSLKFSKDELLDPSRGIANEGLEVSPGVTPNTEQPPEYKPH